MTHRIRLLPLVIGVTYGLSAHAQEGAPTATPAEACFSLENDAARLACYDAALGRTAADTRRADEEATAAKEAEAAARGRNRGQKLTFINQTQRPDHPAGAQGHSVSES